MAEPAASGDPAIGYPALSIEHARRLAAEQGLAKGRFEVAKAQDFSAGEPAGYDLVTIFAALHDMGDPTGARSGSAERRGPTGPE